MMALVKITCLDVTEYVSISSAVVELMSIALVVSEYMEMTLTVEDSI